MAVNKRLFIVLWLAGFAGVLSFLLLDISKIIEILPPGTEVPPMPFVLIKVLGLIQPSVILTVAILVGIGIAPQVGLSAPAARLLQNEAIGRQPFVADRPGIIGGIVGGTLIVSVAACTRPYLSAEAIELIGKFGALMPLPTRFFTAELPRNFF